MPVPTSIYEVLLAPKISGKDKQKSKICERVKSYRQHFTITNTTDHYIYQFDKRSFKIITSA